METPSEPHPKKPCTVDLRGGEESDDSSVVFTGSAPAPPAPAPPAKSIKVMKEAIRAAGLGTSDLLERSHVEERYEQALARLEEADKAPSAAPATSSNGYAWQPLLTRAIGGADSPGNRCALSFADVMAGSPLWAVVSNFQINGHTFKKYCSPLLSVERLIVFHGCARSARDLRSCAPNATIYDMTPKKLSFGFKNDYGCHHSKAFLIGFDDSLRVAIHTANIISCDINNKTQGIWMQNFPIKKAGAPATSDFEEQLVKYFLSLQKHAARMPQSWMGLGAAFGGDEQLTIAQALRKFDFSGAKARLVASTPGYHSGADLHSFGANRVAALLANEGDAAAQKPTDKIYCQFSSLSSPTKPLAVLKAAFHAPKRLCPSPPEVDLSIVWPTAAEVCASVEGYGAGGALPSAQKNVDKAPREMLCRWTKDGSSDFVTARRRAMPHIKTWTRVSGDGSTVRWSVLTSANLSGGAWGNVRDGGRTLFIMHWELGVLVTPSILGAPLRTTQGSEGAIVPLPFPCPPRPYAQGDVPFSWEARYETPDRWGKHGTR
ncbi:unnamed protein product [Pelagomonas calceolata]|uniref:Tyrosyl-DNA phosphodiesterase 1 n=1 Tax=Pelagomonas calceolata TaxID=35677 RepID=A0A8J2WV59_9STRA|nr:unnamed protein product [Pelagomonas calceolata]